MREYEFELRLCAHLEAAGPPPGYREAAADGAGSRPAGERSESGPIVARQLGAGAGRRAGRRVMDVVLASPGPQIERRGAIGPSAIPAAALDGDASVAEWRRLTAVLEGPPERARSIAEDAVEAGFFQRDRRDGTDVVRQVARYPSDWFDELVGVENKPDLGRPGELATQLRTDVSLGLLDRVVLATASHVTGAHLNRIPDAVGVWRVDPGRAGEDDAVEVVRPATRLAVEEPGLQVLERRPDRAEVRVADAAEKARSRRVLAERAYGKGWRPALPSCGTAEAGAVAGTPALPACAFHDRVVDPARACGPDCPGHEPRRPPAVDRAAEREAGQPWVARPAGLARRQSSLSQFVGGTD